MARKGMPTADSNRQPTELVLTRTHSFQCGRVLGNRACVKKQDRASHVHDGRVSLSRVSRVSHVSCAVPAVSAFSAVLGVPDRGRSERKFLLFSLVSEF